MGAKLPKDVARKRVLYGSRPMTAKELARKLQARCFKSFGTEALMALKTPKSSVYLPAQNLKAKRREKMVEGGGEHSYIDVGLVFAGGPPGTKFHESHMYHFSISEEHYRPLYPGASNGRWTAEWTATIFVSDDLEIFAEELRGNVPRSVLACALSD